MKRDREELENRLIKIISSGVVKVKVKKEVIAKLKEHNITFGYASTLLGGNIPAIQDARHEVIYLLTKYLNEVLQEPNLNIDNWFFEEQIKTYDQFKAETYIKNDKIVFTNVLKTSDYEYLVGNVYYSQMADISNQGLLFYNERTQRESNLIAFGDSFLAVPGRNTKKVNEIIEMMKTNFEANLITLNIRKIGTEKFIYNEKAMTLTIEIDNENTFLDIIDGFHRWQAAVKAIRDNPNNQGYFHVKIFNITEERAQAYLAREEKATPMDITHVSGMDKKDIYTAFVDEINQFGTIKNNELFGKIAINYTELKTQDKYVTTQTLALAIKHNFNLKDISIRETGKLQEYLVKFYNETLGILSEKYKKEDSIIFDNNTFIGYTAFAEMLQNKPDWKSILETILNSIDFSRGSFWKGTGITSEKVDDNIVRKVSEHFIMIGRGNTNV